MSAKFTGEKFANIAGNKTYENNRIYFSKDLLGKINTPFFSGLSQKSYHGVTILVGGLNSFFATKFRLIYVI